MKQLPIQRCVVCDEPTGRCNEDSIYIEPIIPDGSFLGPLCESCYASYDTAVIEQEPK